MNFESNFLEIDGNKFELDFPIRTAKKINGLVIVIFDHSDKIPKYSQYQNCMAFDMLGNHVWTAEHPTNSNADYYIDFMDKNRIWNFSCFVCEIDFDNGKLLNAHFTK